MEGVFVNGKPLSEVVEENAQITDMDKKPVKLGRQKFIQIHGYTELHVTGCAVSTIAGIDRVPDVAGDEAFEINILVDDLIAQDASTSAQMASEKIISEKISAGEISDYDFGGCFAEPNKDWKEWVRVTQNNPDKPLLSKPERAWVKIYRWLYPNVNSLTKGRVQTIKIEMPFLGESVDECWGEVQVNVKRAVVRSGRKVDLELVKFGRHKSFDTRRGEFGEWVEDTKPIEPKKEHDRLGSHYYISLRLYHQSHLPENQPEWKFEPLYISIAGEDFYRIDAEWKDEEITITSTLLDDDSPEIPNFLRR